MPHLWVTQIQGATMLMEGRVVLTNLEQSTMPFAQHAALTIGQLHQVLFQKVMVVEIVIWQYSNLN